MGKAESFGKGLADGKRALYGMRPCTVWIDGMGLLIFVGGGMVGIMSDFELLSLVLMILAIIIPLLIAYIEAKK